MSSENLIVHALIVTSKVTSNIKYFAIYINTLLRNLKMKDLELPSPNKHLIYKNLCPYHKVLWSKSTRLHSLGKINGFFIFGGTVKIKVTENRLSFSIIHVDEFQKYFLDSDLSSP